MSTRRKPLSPRELEARRANARRSTGPRTALGKFRSRSNALKHGLYARTVSPPPALVEFDERPDDYRSLLSELLEAHAPADGAERQFVEEIATLRWQRRRNLRGQHALMLAELASQERGQLSAQAAGHSLADAPWEEVQEKGLLGAPDSPGNFRQALDLLEDLRKDVDARRFPALTTDLFRTLFGVKPTMRQAQILALYHYFSSGDGVAPDADEDTDSDADAAPGRDFQPGENGGEPGTERAAGFQDRVFFNDLRLALAEEMLAVTERFERYLDEHAALSRAQREACLAPRGAIPDWRLLLRHEEMLGREIDRKTRLLLHLQRERQARRAGEGRPAASPIAPAGAPGGGPARAGRPRRRVTARPAAGPRTKDSGFRRQGPGARVITREDFSKRTEEAVENPPRPAVEGRNEPEDRARRNGNGSLRLYEGRARRRASESAESARAAQGGGIQCRAGSDCPCDSGAFILKLASNIARTSWRVPEAESVRDGRRGAR